jgi:chromosome segregation ATPase
LTVLESLRTTRSELGAALSELKAARSELQSTTMQLQRTHSDNLDLRKEYERAIKLLKRKTSEILGYEVERESWTVSLTDYRNTIDEHCTTIIQHCETIMELQNEISDHKADIKSLKHENKSLREQSSKRFADYTASEEQFAMLGARLLERQEIDHKLRREKRRFLPMRYKTFDSSK